MGKTAAQKELDAKGARLRRQRHKRLERQGVDGARMRAAAALTGWTHRQLAREVGAWMKRKLTRQAITGMLNGQYEPSQELREALARVIHERVLERGLGVDEAERAARAFADPAGERAEVTDPVTGAVLSHRETAGV